MLENNQTMTRQKRAFYLSMMKEGPGIQRVSSKHTNGTSGPTKTKRFASTSRKYCLLVKALLVIFFFTTFIFPSYVMESGIMDTDEGSHSLRRLLDKYGRSIRQSSQQNPQLSISEATPLEDNPNANNGIGNELYNYDSIYASNGAHESYRDRRLAEFSSFAAYTNSAVVQDGCRLTTVIMDPRIPEASFNHSVWYTLESVATYAPYTCFVVQTSACNILLGKNATPQMQLSTVSQRIYERSLPLFRRMMERGQVRIAILNHTKYKLKSCSDFFNPSSALMNIHYWKDEFIDNVDSEMILVVQDDAVLCHPFDISLWNDLAFVGGLWPPKWSYKFGWCHQMAVLWKGLILAKQNRLRRQNQPQYQSVSQLKNLCTNGYGPTGNGGFSLRNKNWMIRAIQECPYLPFSGTTNKNTECSLKKFQNEDLYFGTVLLGLEAPLPSAYEAALFSTEMLWPEQAEEFFGTYTQSQRNALIERRWGSDGLPLFERMQNPKVYGADFNASLLRTVSIGLHKPWHYQPNDILDGKQVTAECKFLKYIFKPSMTKYDGATWRFPAPTFNRPNAKVNTNIETHALSYQEEKAARALFTEAVDELDTNSTIPHTLWFTHSNNIVSDKSPSHFYQNVLKTVQKYAASFEEMLKKVGSTSAETRALFLDNKQCHLAVKLASPSLAPYFLEEKSGAFKGDICRVAVLYLYGGYYFDVDMEVITPFIVEDSSTLSFVSVRDTDVALFQSFIASTARNPVLKEGLASMLDYYEGRHKTCTRQNNCLMGTQTLMDAYRSVVSKSSSITTALLRQDKLRSGFYPELPRHSRPGCNFIVHDPNKRKAYFYSRIEGSSGCPFLNTGSKASEWCGGGFVGNGTCSDPTFCCSRYGWCGKSAEFCSKKVDRKIEGKSSAPCGGGKIGNGICSDPTSCCSRFGWCGKTPEHCGKAKFS